MERSTFSKCTTNSSSLTNNLNKCPIKGSSRKIALKKPLETQKIINPRSNSPTLSGQTITLETPQVVSKQSSVNDSIPETNLKNELNAKLKHFNELKQRLIEMQTEFLEAFNSLKSIQQKIDCGKNYTTGEIKLISITHNNANGRLLIKNPGNLSITPKLSSMPFTTLARSTKTGLSKERSEIIEIKNKIFALVESVFMLCRKYFVDLSSQCSKNAEGKHKCKNLLKEALDKIDLQFRNKFSKKEIELKNLFNKSQTLPDNLNITKKSTNFELKNENENLKERLMKTENELSEFKKALEISQKEKESIKEEIYKLCIRYIQTNQLEYMVKKVKKEIENQQIKRLIQDEEIYKLQNNLFKIKNILMLRNICQDRFHYKTFLTGNLSRRDIYEYERRKKRQIKILVKKITV